MTWARLLYEDKPMTDIKYGCCQECGCSITMGHYTHCSKYVPNNPVPHVFSDEAIRKIDEAREALLNEGKPMTDNTEKMPDIDTIVDECIWLFKITLQNRLKELKEPHYPQAELDRRIAEAEERQRERCAAVYEMCYGPQHTNPKTKRAILNATGEPGDES